MNTQPELDLVPYLKLMVDKQASDLFLSVGAPPNIKLEGLTYPLGHDHLRPGAVKALAYSIMNERQIREFEGGMEANLGLSVEGIGRFRVNVFVQKGETSMVIRYIKARIPGVAELNLPPVLERLALEKRGLVLLVGAAGSGKSTTMASLVDYRNSHTRGHILTIEDPIEFLHEHKESVVDQREVGIDTLSYEEALKNAMREAPDVIVIGEIRDRTTMQHAIAYAETGHLCISTLHANNSNQAVERILNFFPEDARRQLLLDLSLNLKGVVSQRLVPGLAAKLVPAVEVLLWSPYVADLIQKGRVDEVKTAMAKSNDLGMQTFDQSLFDLYLAGKISLDEALRNADSRTDLAVRVRLSKERSSAEAPDLTLRKD